MEIKHTTVRKILEEIIPETTAEERIKVEGREAQNQYLEKLYNEKLKNRKGISAYLKKGWYRGQRDAKYDIDLYFTGLDSSDSSGNQFVINFSSNFLALSEYYTPFYIPDISIIDKLEEKYREKYTVIASKELKKNKIKQLKMSAILAALKEIAQELNVEYNYKEQKYRILLFIKLSNKNALKITVPYKNFQEIVPKLKTTITEILEWQKKGIDFEIKGNAGSLGWLS